MAWGVLKMGFFREQINTPSLFSEVGPPSLFCLAENPLTKNWPKRMLTRVNFSLARHFYFFAHNRPTPQFSSPGPPRQ